MKIALTGLSYAFKRNRLMTNGARYDVSHRRKKGLKDLITKQVKINGKTKDT